MCGYGPIRYITLSFMYIHENVKKYQEKIEKCLCQFVFENLFRFENKNFEFV